MADLTAMVAALVLLVAVSPWMPISLCAKKPIISPRKEDVPFIKCQVCEKLASQILLQVQNKQSQISPKKISEYQIIEISENICDLKKEEADWIMKIDIVEKGDRLQLVEQQQEGQCNSECKTIEQACQQIMGFSDTDVAEYVYAVKPTYEMLRNNLCLQLTDACSKKAPLVPKDRIPGEPFTPKPSKDVQMSKILRNIQGMPGAPSMSMYSREELMNMNNLGNEEDDDDDEDEQAQFASNLKNILTQKQSWMQKIMGKINRLWQWWRRSKGTNTETINVDL